MQWRCCSTGSRAAPIARQPHRCRCTRAAARISFSAVSWGTGMGYLPMEKPVHACVPLRGLHACLGTSAPSLNIREQPAPQQQIMSTAKHRSCRAALMGSRGGGMHMGHARVRDWLPPTAARPERNTACCSTRRAASNGGHTGPYALPHMRSPICARAPAPRHHMSACTDAHIYTYLHMNHES